MSEKKRGWFCLFGYGPAVWWYWPVILFWEWPRNFIVNWWRLDGPWRER